MVCSSSDLIVTFLLTLTLLAVEAYEFVQYLLSDWFIASLLCNYARKQQPVRKQLVKRAPCGRSTARARHQGPQVTMLQLHQLHPRRVDARVHLLKAPRRAPDAIVTVDAKMAIVREEKSSAWPRVSSSRKQLENGASGDAGICVRREGMGMLLEFWAELLVFIARRPEGGPEAHMSAGQRRQFITHIWAMLTTPASKSPSTTKRTRPHQAISLITRLACKIMPITPTFNKPNAFILVFREWLSSCCFLKV
ncbi:hypothetical protein ZWY2020_049761 [Hordeum vulgare]|nr:hypothetical protein ZWY2020_049761 [Hordeum vulgare]